MKKFVTIFNCQNVNLIKDNGLIAYGMFKYEDYDSYVATYDNGGYTYLDNEVKGLKLLKIKKITGHFTLDAAIFLSKHSKDIDILNLYFATVDTSFLAKIYKMHNKNGFLYIKLDGGFFKSEYKYLTGIRTSAYKLGDLITAELEYNRKILTNDFKVPIFLLRDPYNPSELRDYIPFSKRNNTIVAVGRLGTAQKRTEDLLSAFLSIYKEIPSWKLQLIGPITDNFNKKLKDTIDLYPDLKDRIIYCGNIENRKELFDIYYSSKIFVMPSLFESFGLSLMEASISGCFIICSEIPAFDELTQNYKNAGHFTIGDVDKLASEMLYYCNNLDEAENKAITNRNYLKDICNLKNICDTLNTYIENKQHASKQQ